jgi:hypothetical protein
MDSSGYCVVVGKEDAEYFANENVVVTGDALDVLRVEAYIHLLITFLT